jgi:hypothetical protein
MTELPLHLRDGHLFLELDGALWLLDTGAPASFGAAGTVTIEGRPFELERSYVGLDAATLSGWVGVPCAGLLGADVLGEFDALLDAPRGRATVSSATLEHTGTSIALEQFMGIPIFAVEVRGARHRMFFDTGAQVSYFQDDALSTFPAAGKVQDFYPGVGRFETDTFTVDAAIGGVPFRLRCGSLPPLLVLTLPMAGVSGIVGNELLADRAVGYFPRRGLLVL